MRIIHVFRGVAGGLFRHVCDQVEGQAEAGHDVGIVCDRLTGGVAGSLKLAHLAPYCTLGIMRTAMHTLPSLADLKVLTQITDLARRVNADILHGHGAKGGLYARLAARMLGIASAYVPHGGSLHYEWSSAKGVLFLTSEKALRVKRSGLVFVCEFERTAFAEKIGLGACASRVIYNGLGPKDFQRRVLLPGATDLLFVGELRSIKGVDLLLRALARISADRRPSLTIVGEGAQETEFKALSSTLDIAAKVTFVGRRPMAEAMGLGRILVVPSRRESFPYVVIEAMAAGMPVMCSDVGGISEALPAAHLFKPENAASLAAHLMAQRYDAETLSAETEELRTIAARRFSTPRMVAETLDFYRQLI